MYHNDNRSRNQKQFKTIEVSTFASSDLYKWIGYKFSYFVPYNGEEDLI